MSRSLRDADYLRHMLEAIERVRDYTDGKAKIEFLRERMMQDAVIRNIEIIGEAANRLSPAFVAAHDEVAWSAIAGMRHRLIHGYMTVNLNTVWNVVERELPALENTVRLLLERMAPPTPGV